MDAKAVEAIFREHRGSYAVGLIGEGEMWRRIYQGLLVAATAEVIPKVLALAGQDGTGKGKTIETCRALRPYTPFGGVPWRK